MLRVQARFFVRAHEGSRSRILTDDHAMPPEDVGGFLELTALGPTPNAKSRMLKQGLDRAFTSALCRFSVKVP